MHFDWFEHTSDDFNYYSANIEIIFKSIFQNESLTFESSIKINYKAKGNHIKQIYSKKKY